MTDSGIIVQGLTPEFANEAGALVASVISSTKYYNDWAKRSECAKYSSDALRSMMHEDQDSVLVALSRGKVVGFCISRYDDGTVWLSWFGVCPDYRRRGIGDTLLRNIIARTQEKMLHKIWCDTRTDNHESQRALLRQGFSVLCKVSNHWYGQDFLIWERLLGD